MSNYSTVASLNSDILNLFDKFIQINNNNENSCNMDICSILNVLKFIYNGTADNKRKDLDKTNLSKIVKMAPQAQDSRVGILIRNDYKYNEDFKNINKNKAYIGTIPTNEIEIERINRLINKKYPKWLEHTNEKFLLEFIPSNIYLYIKDESYFIGNWKNPFNPEDTYDDTFYCGNRKTKNIPMMKSSSSEYIDTYNCKDTNSLIIRLEYDNDYNMMIIMPNITHTKQELINFYRKNLDGDKIINYISKLESIKYIEKIMPKFKSKSEWELNNSNINLSTDDDDKTPYLSKIFDKNMDFSNISSTMKGVSEEMNLKMVSNIDNNEIGTTVLSEVMFYATDSIVKNPNVLILNKSFIYMIMDKNNIITNFGLFVG